jgi:hypothetical protein
MEFVMMDATRSGGKFLPFRRNHALGEGLRIGVGVTKLSHSSEASDVVNANP